VCVCVTTQHLPSGNPWQDFLRSIFGETAGQGGLTSDVTAASREGWVADEEEEEEEEGEEWEGSEEEEGGEEEEVWGMETGGESPVAGSAVEKLAGKEKMAGKRALRADAAAAKEKGGKDKTETGEKKEKKERVRETMLYPMQFPDEANIDPYDPQTFGTRSQKSVSKETYCSVKRDL
jgi:hypothetical protein